ncbi:MAG TPA: PA14 domain-containing protein [Syntrophales bacterium]|nr:PA14 domain-containing protein [Syntrophales bacterium]
MKIRRIIKISILFTMAICICSLAFASGMDRRQMEITYENGEKQQVSLQQSSDNIIRHEFKEVTSNPLPLAKSDFGSTKPIVNSLKGEVYFIAEGVSYLPNLDGQSVVSRLYTTTINISPRRFDSGLPGIPNRLEWFAIRYTGEFYIKKGGVYRFRTVADDGCWLVIDGKTVIEDRQSHAPTSAYGEIHLYQGMHQVRVDYFHGPRHDLALQLFVTRPGGSERIFDLNDFSF